MTRLTSDFMKYGDTRERVKTTYTQAAGRRAGYANAEFRKGLIEVLPLADCSAGVVPSNCVISLSPDNPQVFREACHVLRPVGRLAISDLVMDRALPPSLRGSMEAIAWCLPSAVLRDDCLDAIRAAGFRNIQVISQHATPVLSISRCRQPIPRRARPEQRKLRSPLSWNRYRASELRYADKDIPNDKILSFAHAGRSPSIL